MWLPLVVVTLPTVCLLWFMQQAVRNERLAVKQRLIELYGQTAARARSEMEQYWVGLSERLSHDLPEEGPAAFKQIVLRRKGEGPAEMRSAVILGPDGRIVYPTILSGSVQRAVEQDQVLLEVMQVEYVLKDYMQAARLYKYLAKTSPDPNIRLAAAAGAARCLNAIGDLQGLVDPVLSVTDSVRLTADTAEYVFGLRLRALEVMADMSIVGLEQQFASILGLALDYDENLLPSSTRALGAWQVD
ncbi:MAG: hypothetical protein QHH07_02670 [Sedimentisphaerales bacterium]|nr:hypothetical protein [Sedimentisphaerales bacterium]